MTAAMTGLGDLLRATKEDCGVGLGDLTVLSPQNDPFRLDTPTNHEVGKWFRDQMERCGLLSRVNPIHNRGVFYAVVSKSKAKLPSGLPYKNDLDCWDFLERASKAARWLGYVPFEKIIDARNAEPIIRIAKNGDPRWFLSGLDPNNETFLAAVTAMKNLHGGWPSSRTVSVRRNSKRRTQNMKNDLAKRIDYDALDSAIGSDIDGDPLRFKDGVFIRGFDKIEVEEGTTLRIAPTSVQDGYVKWEDHKPVDWKLREWTRRDQLPVFRDTLGDADKIDQPDDPWVYTLLLAMKDADDVQLKFSTSTVGGERAVRKVLREWKRLRDKHPGQVPVVALGSDSYQHKVHRTEVQFPVFTIVSWDYWDEADKASAKALPSYVTPDDPRTQIRDELDGDDLPF